MDEQSNPPQIDNFISNDTFVPTEKLTEAPPEIVINTLLPTNSASSPPPLSTPSPGYNRVSVIFLLLIFLLVILAIPKLAEQIAYSLNRGTERAKVDIARQLLADLPLPEQRIPWVAKAVAPCVVGIQTFTLSRREGVEMDIGSGVIVDTKGYLLTNHHVVANAKKIMVQLTDGRTLEAQVVGRDQTTDLAVLKIEETKLDAITWGDSREIVVGDQVVAIGNPYNLGQTVTSGIISATERYNPLPAKNMIQEFLQTDAAINPGNSGGALVNLKGELIGINTAILSETNSNSGIGFAIPSLLVKKVYEEILKHGEVKHGWLGLQLGSAPKGVFVLGLLPTSPAREAGIKMGDIITKWGETEITTPIQLVHLVVLSQPGETVTVTILRKKETITCDVVVGVRPVELRRQP